ncbi:MAG: hypothetical protein QMC81_11650 [Thermoanaerobacterales bacterium]|nr:hypothetical protein [Thermoanaerobacterales bacterium]
MNEALDAYLAKAEEKRAKDLEEVLALAGTLSRAEAEDAEKAIGEAWAKWRLS